MLLIGDAPHPISESGMEGIKTMGKSRGRCVIGLMRVTGAIGVAGLLFVALVLAMGGSSVGDVFAVEGQPARAVASPTVRTYSDLLLDDARGVIYAAGTDDVGDDILDVVDLDTLAITDTVMLPLEATGLALSGDGSELAVASASPYGVAFVDLESGEVSPPLSLSAHPTSVVYGRPGRLYAGYQRDSGVPAELAIVDTISRTVVSTVTLSAAQPGVPQLVISGDGADLYALVAANTNPIFKLNAFSDTLPVAGQTPAPVEAQVLAVAADGSRVFTDKAIWDGDLGELLAAISIPEVELIYNVVYEPALERVYFQTSSALRVFDAVTGEQVDVYQEAFESAGFVVSASRQRLYYVTGQGTFNSLPWRYYYMYLPGVTRTRPPIYVDDFDDPASGWVVEDTPDIRWSYQQGEYELLVRNPEWWAGVVDPIDLGPVLQYRIDVDVRQATEANALHAVIFEWRDWRNFRLLAIVPGAGLVGLYEVSNGSLVTHQELAPHAAAAVGTAWHHVRIEQSCCGTVVWIDGVEVIEATMAQPPPVPFRVGFYLETGEQTPAVLRVDEVLVRHLPQDSPYPESQPSTPLSAPAAAGDGERWLGALLGSGGE